jgi:membrane associated rhomboid family serine protease
VRSKKKKSAGFSAESQFAFMVVGMNFAAFALTHYHPGFQKYLPSLILYPENLIHGKLWCLLTSGFIHRDWSHLLFNMAGVLIFGRIVERRLGVAKTAIIYFGTLFLSMLLTILAYTTLLHKQVAIIGASGAVMGLIAAAMLLEPFCITYEMILPIPMMIKGWMFLYADFQGFLSGERDGISHLAHLCGFMSIAILVYFFSHEDRRTLSTGLIVNILSFMGFLYLRQCFLHLAV